MINWKLFSLLLAASIITSIAILPFIILVQGSILQSLPIPLPITLSLQLVQAAAVFAVSIFVGLLLSKRIGMGAPILEAWLARKKLTSKILPTLLIAIFLGLFAGTLIIFANASLAILTSQPAGIPTEPTDFSAEPIGQISETITRLSPTPSQAVLLALYGGIVEEIVMRLFIMTFLVWILYKFLGKGDSRVWFAIFIAALLFGIAHLPLVATLSALTPYLITRTILLSGIGGIIFGWLYWKKGLESAMVAHFSTDIFLFLILPFFF